jgi:hypothetical protein
MNIVRNKASSITTICDIIADEINKDLLRPSDVLALSTYLIKIVLCDLVGDNQATIATNRVSSILCSTIADNRKEQNTEAVYGETI